MAELFIAANKWGKTDLHQRMSEEKNLVYPYKGVLFSKKENTIWIIIKILY